MPRNNRSRAAVAVTSSLFVLLAVPLLLWANDVRQDRMHTVSVESAAPVFPGKGQNCDTRKQGPTVQRGTTLQVRRIRYWKDCATLDVNMPNGRSGHFVLGVGDLNVQPPLR